MRAVNISDLKAQLSAHIQFVRDGEEVLVFDRNKPEARIVPCRPESDSRQERSHGSWPEPPGNVSDKVMEQLWRAKSPLEVRLLIRKSS